MKYYVYKLIDPTTNEPFYVGKGCGTRMYHHRRDAINPRYKCYRSVHRKIQSVLAKKLDIAYERIECSSEHDAFLLELQLIQTIGRKDLGLGPLCNLTDGGEGSSNQNKISIQRRALKHTGMKRSSDAKRNMSRAQRQLRLEGYVPSIETKKKMSAKRRIAQTLATKDKHRISASKCQVMQLTVDGQPIKQWPSMSSAAKALNIDVRNIGSACDRACIANGFKWQRIGDAQLKQKCVVGQYDLLTNELLNTFNTTVAAGAAVGCDQSSIVYCCNGRTSSCSGYAWRYIPVANKKRGSSPNVLQIDIMGNTIATHFSARQASRATGVNDSCITKCCNKKTKTAGGFVWRWAPSEVINS